MEDFEIKLLEIPDETTLIIMFNDIKTISELDLDKLINDLLNYHNITCVCFKGDTETSKEIGELSKYIKSTYNMKTSWFTNRNNFPFKSNLFDYIRIQDGLYMNISENKDELNGRFISINNKVITDKSQLDPLEDLYFEKYEELKEKLSK